MTVDERIFAFQTLSASLKGVLQGKTNGTLVEQIENEYISNPWFIPVFVQRAIAAIGEMLNEHNLREWTSPYLPALKDPQKTLRIGVVMAGNIPLVGFHDFLSVLMSGHIFVGKLSSNDAHLLPIIAEMLCEIEPRFLQQIVFQMGKLTDIDKIIATGDNNSSRYFSYYFQKYPSIIRRHCNSVAVLNGKESEKELHDLADDIFLYFGLGCRSISKIYIPKDYDFVPFFEALDKYREIANLHSKYLNNLEYQKTVHLLNAIPFLDQGISIFKEKESFASPIGVIHYQYYDDINILEEEITSLGENLQCVVSNFLENPTFFPLGQSQYPRLTDYANGIDTMEFLLKE